MASSHKKVEAEGAQIGRLVFLVKQSPCFDCDKRFKPHELQFDHRISKFKEFNVGRSRDDNGKSSRDGRDFEAVLAEISKCDLLCNACAEARNAKFGDHKTKQDESGNRLYTSEMRAQGEMKMRTILMRIIRRLA